jgi:hypothetical protein
MRCKRPTGCCTTEKRDELAPSHMLLLVRH